MENTSLARIESSLRLQREALSELIEIALAAVKESGDSSVSAIHLSKRLQNLSDSLKDARVSTLEPSAQTRAR